MYHFRHAGEELPECTGWIKPAHFVSGIYASMVKTGKPEGDPFDSAYLMTRYRSQYDLKEIPSFVKKVIFPITGFIGKLLGKYDLFKEAPEPVK